MGRDAYKHQRQKYHRQMIMTKLEAQEMAEKAHVLNDPEINDLMDDIINSTKAGTASELLATFAPEQPRIDLRKKKTLDNFQLRKDIVQNEKNLSIEYNVYLRDKLIGTIKPAHTLNKDYDGFTSVKMDVRFYSEYQSVIPNGKATNVKDMMKLITGKIEATRDFIRLFESD